MKIFFTAFLVTLVLLSPVSAFASPLERGTSAYETSLLQDLAERQKLAQTELPHSAWYTSQELRGWGPMPRQYPGIHELISRLPHGTDITAWKRDRIVAVAKHYIGLPYRHHHIPAWSPTVPDHSGQTGPGLDCSNFTSWVYNFAFGLILNGDVVLQSEMKPRAGFPIPEGMRKISPAEGFEPGDILYILDSNHKVVVHAVIYIDEEHIIDSTDGHVAIRHFSGWYRNRLSHGLRIFN